MTDHEVTTHEEWLAARKELLEREKELTRRSDELARQRLELPWVLVEKRYTFDTDEGTKTLPSAEEPVSAAAMPLAVAMPRLAASATSTLSMLLPPGCR